VSTCQLNVMAGAGLRRSLLIQGGYALFRLLLSRLSSLLVAHPPTSALIQSPPHTVPTYATYQGVAFVSPSSRFGHDCTTRLSVAVSSNCIGDTVPLHGFTKLQVAPYLLPELSCPRAQQWPRWLYSIEN